MQKIEAPFANVVRLKYSSIFLLQVVEVLSVFLQWPRNKTAENHCYMILFSDMPLFGLCPAQDEFYLVVCETCKQVVKPQALLRHMGMMSIHFTRSLVLNFKFRANVTLGKLLVLVWKRCIFASLCTIITVKLDK